MSSNLTMRHTVDVSGTDSAQRELRAHQRSGDLNTVAGRTGTQRPGPTAKGVEWSEA